MNKIKVLHLLKSNEYSGAESVVCQIIEIFKSQEKFDMIYVSPSGQIEEELSKRKIPYYPLNSFKQSEIDRAVNYINPDIIHAHDFTASVRASKYQRKNYIIISHLHNNPFWIQKINYKTLIYTYTLNKYYKVIGVSPSILDEFIFRDKLEKKFVLLSNTVNKDLIIKKSNESCELSIDILFVGRLTYQKQPLEFLEIIKEVSTEKPDIKAVMIGSGEFYDKCKSYISKYKLEDNVRLLGYVSNPYKYMKNSKLLVMTSIFEGFGLVAVESMILGVPVLCRHVGGLVNIVDNDVGYVCNTIESYCNSIVSLLNNDSKRKQKGSLSKLKAEKFCDLNLYKERLEKIYEDSLYM